MPIGNIASDNFAYHIAHVLGFLPDDDAVYEPHYNDYGICHYVFASRKDRSNCIIQFTPEELDIDW
jgi:hypothetical protein